MSEHTWNKDFPRVTKRGGNQITFEVRMVADGSVRTAIVVAPGKWTDAARYEGIPRADVNGWREPAAKTCYLGNHPIDDVVDRGHVTRWNVNAAGEATQETHACFACDRKDRIKKYTATGDIHTKTWVDALLSHHAKQTVRDGIEDTSPHTVRLILTYAYREARQLLDDADTSFPEQLADAAIRICSLPELARVFRVSVDDSGAPGFGVRLLDRQNGLVGSLCPREQLALYADIRTLYCGEHQFWFDRLMAEMGPVQAAMKRWERAVWFGGHDYSQDDRYTEPYSEHMPDSRAYRRKPAGHGTHFSTREDVLPPGSLQEFVVCASMKGYKATVDGVEYMSWTCAGRSLFQIEGATSRITLILDETSPEARGDIQGIDATGPAAVALIERAISDWEAGKIALVPDVDVGML